METKGQKELGFKNYVTLELKNISNSKACVWYVLLAIAIVGIIIVWKIKEECIMAGYMFALLSSVILSSFPLPILIKFCINEKYLYKTRMIVSFSVNLIFSATPIVFVYNFYESLSKSYYVQVSTLIVLILLLIITCRSTKIEDRIENRYDISLLKSSNLFLVFLFTAIKLIFKEETFLIEYYYLLPLIGLRALYDLFDGKAKKNSKGVA